MLRGDHQGAEAALRVQLASGEGGPASCEASRALLAVVRLRRGDLQPAIDLENEPLSTHLPAVRLFRAASTAGLARRSGDTARLRFAWEEADEVLSRPVTSWLLTEVLAELVLAGVRLGDSRRTMEVVDELVRQAESLGDRGGAAGPVAWLEFQVGVQRGDEGMLTAAAARLEHLAPTDSLGRARAAVALLWADGIASGRVSDDEWVAAAEALAAVGDPFEASRFLGQAALDHPRPTGARRFLEVARTLSVDVADVEGGSGLTAQGLSEREAEVAQFIAEGLTYKEIGARLYISPKTVEHHVARARQKLGVSSRAEFLAAVESSRA
jgi:DNA-binding CsgD family transcriptional regulator